MTNVSLNALYKLLKKNEVTSTEALTNLVDFVKDYLKDLGASVPFFIAGGSVYSITNGGSSYNDVDIFFYTREDVETVRIALKTKQGDVIQTDGSSILMSAHHETDNAITVMNTRTGSIALQFIKLHTGTVEEVLNTFDINLSKRAFTSGYELIILDNNDKFTIDKRNVNGCIISRYNKYTSIKRAKDINFSAFAEIIDFLVENREKTFSAGYNDLPDITGFEILCQAIGPANELNKLQVIHDVIAKQPSDIRLKLFSKMLSLLVINLATKCDEFKLCVLLYRRLAFGDISSKMNDEDKRIQLKYAEYFI